MKLQLLTENVGYSHFDVVAPDNIVRAIDTVPGAETSRQEVAWVGRGTDRRVARGTGKDVKIEIPAGTHEWLVHTHPTETDEEPSVYRALPSEQDLETAIEMREHGMPGMVIFSGDNFVIVRAMENASISPNYELELKQAYKEQDLSSIINKIKQMGFDIGIGRR